MEKIFLQEIFQHGTICYIGKIDPRKLVKVAKKVEMSETQEAQRPLSEKRVKEIAKYVSGSKGILPNTLTIASVDNRFVVKPTEESTIKYIEFPSTDEEYEAFKDAVSVMDGQHRLYSFLPNIKSIPDSEKYEIGFTLYIRPTILERQQIFISCNEKQEKVSGNLLMWFRKELGMLSTDEERFYPIVSALSNEYPLKGHIIMSAEKIKNGVKANYIMSTLKKAGVDNIQANGVTLDDDNLIKVICRYLSAWENVVGFSFVSSSAKQAGPAIKGAGLNYMLQLLPVIWDRSITMGKYFTQDFVEETLRDFITAEGVECSKFFICEKHKMCFGDRTSIDKFANDSKNLIKSLNTGSFNPLQGL